MISGSFSRGRCLERLRRVGRKEQVGRSEGEEREEQMARSGGVVKGRNGKGNEEVRYTSRAVRDKGSRGKNRRNWSRRKDEGKRRVRGKDVKEKGGSRVYRRNWSGKRKGEGKRRVRGKDGKEKGGSRVYITSSVVVRNKEKVKKRKQGKQMGGKRMRERKESVI